MLVPTLDVCVWLKHWVLTWAEEWRSQALLLPDHSLLARSVKEGGVAAEGLVHSNLSGWRVLLCTKTETAHWPVLFLYTLQGGSLSYFRTDQHKIDSASCDSPPVTVDFPICSRPKLAVHTNATANLTALVVHPVHKSRSGKTKFGQVTLKAAGRWDNTHVTCIWP